MTIASDSEPERPRPRKKIAAVSFDAVGTLFGVRGSVGEIYSAVAARHGVSAAAVELEARFHAVWRGMPPLAFPGLAPDAVAHREQAWWKRLVLAVFAEIEFVAFEAFFTDLYAVFATPAAWELYPDTLPTLEALQGRGLRLAVVSNFDARLPPLCDALGLGRFFDAVVTSTQVGYAKPDARIFTAALARLGVRPAEGLHIGDAAEEDVAGARRAGLHALHLQRRASAAAGPGTVRRLSDLLLLLT